MQSVRVSRGHMDQLDPRGPRRGVAKFDPPFHIARTTARVGTFEFDTIT